MENYPDDDDLQALFGNGSNADANFTFQNSALGFNDSYHGSTGERPQYGHSDHSLLPLTSVGELLSLQEPVTLVSSSLVRDGPRLLANDTPLAPRGASFTEASWSDLTGQAFVPDLWNALSPISDETQCPRLVSASPNMSISSYTGEDGGESSESGRKRRRRIPPDAKRLLEACFERHKEDPYIPQEEINELVKLTDLSVKQIRTFFANARARKLPRRTPRLEIPSSKADQQDPMERFLSSSPEDEGLSEDAVREAAQSMSRASSAHSRRRHSSKTDAHSIPDTTFTSSSGSRSSQASFDSANNRGPRRGRKRQREATQKTNESILRKPSDSFKIFQCTFCTADFAQKYDWKRHEESVHFPQKEWTCIPDGAINEDGKCVFCDKAGPDNAHLETHNCNVCIKSPREQRSFLRKDKLVQHLMQVHRVSQPPKAIKDWCRPIERIITIVCGLCGLILPDWGTRADHISSHFGDGKNMNMWLLERPGGIMPHTSPNEGSVRKKYGLKADPSGEFQCVACPNRFQQISQALFHQRQVHNRWSEHDRVRMNAIKSPGQTLGADLNLKSKHNIGARALQKSRLPSHLSPQAVQLSSWSGAPPIRVTASRSLNPDPHAQWRTFTPEQVNDRMAWSHFPSHHHQNSLLGPTVPFPLEGATSHLVPEPMTTSSSIPFNHMGTIPNLVPSRSNSAEYAIPAQGFPNPVGQPALDLTDGIGFPPNVYDSPQQLLHGRKPIRHDSAQTAGSQAAAPYPVHPFIKSGAQRTFSARSMADTFPPSTTSGGGI